MESKLAMNGSIDAVLHQCLAEIQQIPKLQDRQTEVSRELLLESWIDRLKQSGAKVLMHRNHTIHDHGSYLALKHLRVSAAP